MAAKEAERQTKIERKACPKCGAGLNLRHGKNGAFWGCTKYPECDFTETAKRDDAPVSEEVASSSIQRFAVAMKFVQDCGGVANAFNALRSVALMIASSTGESK